ncbi:300_t:CDS:2, partial [Racocetra fulgida]
PMVENAMVESPVVESLIVESSTVENLIIEENRMDESQTEENRPIEENQAEETTKALSKLKSDLTELEASFTDDNEFDMAQSSDNITQVNSPSAILSEFDKILLRRLRSKEYFPILTLVVGKCRHCYTEKKLPKKFSSDNNMDPGDVSEELQGLTEIEEMLIAQVFSVMVVYRLHGGQHDTEEMSLTSLKIDTTTFRDFRVRRGKIIRALSWLKENNRYYSEIVIDNKNLNCLPEDGFIDNQFQINQLKDDDFYEKNDGDVITCTFVPFLLSDDREDVAINKLKSLNIPVAKILAMHHRGGKKAKNADSDAASGLEAELLLARDAHIMLTANLWTEVGLVNGLMGTIQDILFEEGQSLPSLPTAVFIIFDDYRGPTISTLEGTKVVPIIPIQRIWEGLTISKAVIDIGNREFAARLSFVAVSWVRALNDIIFKPFNFERLQQIANCKRAQEKKTEKMRLTSLIPKI